MTVRTPGWVDGNPVNLEAAAADALEWLLLVERLVDGGRWQLGLPGSRDKLRGCREHLVRLLDETGA